MGVGVVSRDEEFGTRTGSCDRSCGVISVAAEDRLLGRHSDMIAAINQLIGYTLH